MRVESLGTDLSTKSKSVGEWVFERVNPMGGARATAWQDTLEGSDLSSEERIAREAIQNSVDATLPEQRTEVFVWDKELSDLETKNFKDLLNLESREAPTGRLPKLGLKEDNSFERIKRGTGGIRVTIIEDRNTCGLGFDEQDNKDRFKELCLFLGQESTAVDSNRGGSYGFGKTVYQALSDSRTFFVYSQFESKPETCGHHARLFGCSSFNGHRMKDGTGYTGRAWFGIPEITDSGQQECNPIVDEEASELAQRLGFMKESNDPGTSIMIVGSNIDISSFREAVEDYWWPRFLSDQLSVELWKDNDQVLAPPQPLERPRLKPYIRCYELLENEIPIEDDERKPKVNAIQGVQRGALALKALPPDPDEQEDPEKDTKFKNTVALIRSGPRMVVQYLNTGGRQRGNFAGAFLSHPDSEYALHLSEPPSHDAWNSNSERLRSAGPTSQKLVDGILHTIKRQTRKFQSELSPAQPPTPVTGVRKLEEILARVMSARGLGPPQRPQSVEDPFQLRIHEGRMNSATNSRVTANIEIKLRDDAPIDNAIAFMSLRPTVVLDDNKRRDLSERRRLSCLTVNGSDVDIEDDSDIRLSISKKDFVTIRAESECFDRDLYADLEVSVRIPETTEGQNWSESQVENKLQI